MKKQTLKITLSLLIIFTIGLTSSLAAPAEISLDLNSKEKTQLIHMFKDHQDLIFYTTEKDLDILATNQYPYETKDWKLKIFFGFDKKRMQPYTYYFDYYIKSIHKMGYYPELLAMDISYNYKKRIIQIDNFYIYDKDGTIILILANTGIFQREYSIYEDKQVFEFYMMINSYLERELTGPRRIFICG